MRNADLVAVGRLAERIHPHYPEAPVVFAERMTLAPEGCHVLTGDEILGYAVAHPWTGLAPPPLNSLLGRLPDHPGAWHLHDVALTEAVRSAGYGKRLLDRWPHGTLVAIDGTASYWLALGFRDAPCLDPVALASYGSGARFMAR